MKDRWWLAPILALLIGLAACAPPGGGGDPTAAPDDQAGESDAADPESSETPKPGQDDY
jgi:hypothetical protein